MNTVPEYTEEIARLILQRISGTIGEEEAGLLDAWRKADPANEETYRRLFGQRFPGTGMEADEVGRRFAAPGRYAGEN